MIAAINAFGYQDSLGNDRLKEIRGLLKFEGKPVLRHILDNLPRGRISSTLIFVNPEHRREYEREFGNEESVEIIEYNGEHYPLKVYLKILKDALEYSEGEEDVLIVADDNLFDFSLDGMVGRFDEVDGNVVAVRRLNKIYDGKNTNELNFGTCIADLEGRITVASLSFEPGTAIDSDLVVLDIYMIQRNRIPQNQWYEDCYIWEPQGGFWVDVGKQQLREKAREYYASQENS